jgi:hypothetical protein
LETKRIKLEETKRKENWYQVKGKQRGIEADKCQNDPERKTSTAVAG